MKKVIAAFLLFIINGYSLLILAQGQTAVTPAKTGKEQLPAGKWACGSGTSTDSITLQLNGTFTESAASVIAGKKKKANVLMVKQALTGNWEITSGTDSALVLSFSWIEAGSKVIHKKTLQYDIRKDLLSTYHRY